MHYLHKRKGRECDFFRGFSEKGHYKHRGTNETRQGIYCVTPSGRFLASINHTSAERVLAMLDEAMIAWNELPEKDRYLDPAPTDKETGRGNRGEPLRPKDGLVLRSYVRDLRSTKGASARDWRGSAWNTDVVWFRSEETRGFAPEKLTTGAQHDIPRALLLRLAQYTFIDSVRGQTLPFEQEHIQSVSLRSTIVAREGDRVSMTYVGESHAEAIGKWSVHGRSNKAVPQKRGIKGVLAGRAVFDTKTQRFVELELTLKGTRWGGTKFNFRHDDLERAPIGFALKLVPEDSTDKLAPAFWWRYWR